MIEVPDDIRVVYVRSKKALYIYELVRAGLPEDIGMAYDLKIRSSAPTTMYNMPHGIVQVEEVADLVALDRVRAELGLYRPNVFKDLLNAGWRKLRLDNAPQASGPDSTTRLYRVGHPKHVPGF